MSLTFAMRFSEKPFVPMTFMKVRFFHMFISLNYPSLGNVVSSCFIIGNTD